MYLPFIYNGEKDTLFMLKNKKIIMVKIGGNTNFPT